jgi:hypothetical protein
VCVVGWGGCYPAPTLDFRGQGLPWGGLPPDPGKTPAQNNFTTS